MQSHHVTVHTANRGLESVWTIHTGALTGPPLRELIFVKMPTIPPFNITHVTCNSPCSLSSKILGKHRFAATSHCLHILMRLRGCTLTARVSWPRVLLALAAVTSSLALSPRQKPSFRWGTEPVRGVNLGGWLVLEVGDSLRPLVLAVG